MKDIINCIKKDTLIIACKKRAKEILKKNPDLTLMKCMDLSAQELKFNHWHELHTYVKNKNHKNKDVIEIWENLINELLKKDYEAIHFEVRGYQIKVKARKFGLLNELNTKVDITFISKVLKELNIIPVQYDWLERKNYNIQAMPVMFEYRAINREIAKNDLTINDCYDVVIVKKENTINSIIEKGLDFNDALKEIGFSLLNISDIKYNFTQKNYIIGGYIGSGSQKIAERIVKELLNKNQKVYFVSEESNQGQLKEDDIKRCLKDNFDYIYIPELRFGSGIILNRLLKYGVKLITTIHTAGIDLIKDRLESVGVNTNLIEESTLLMYQKVQPILCNECKEEENSFERIVKEDNFLDYLRKHKKTYEGKLFRKSNKMMCSNKDCHHGLVGRLLIAETLNLEVFSSNLNYNNLIKEKGLNAFRENRIGEFLRLKSADYHSNRFKKVLEGILEL